MCWNPRPECCKIGSSFHILFSGIQAVKTVKNKQALYTSEVSRRTGWCLSKGNPEGQESKQRSASVTGASAAYSKHSEIPLETSLLILSRKILSD